MKHTDFTDLQLEPYIDALSVIVTWDRVVAMRTLSMLTSSKRGKKSRLANIPSYVVARLQAMGIKPEKVLTDEQCQQLTAVYLRLLSNIDSSGYNETGRKNRQPTIKTQHGRFPMALVGSPKNPLAGYEGSKSIALVLGEQSDNITALFLTHFPVYDTDSPVFELWQDCVKLAIMGCAEDGIAQVAHGRMIADIHAYFTVRLTKALTKANASDPNAVPDTTNRAGRLTDREKANFANVAKAKETAGKLAKRLAKQAYANFAGVTLSRSSDQEEDRVKSVRDRFAGYRKMTEEERREKMQLARSMGL